MDSQAWLLVWNIFLSLFNTEVGLAALLMVSCLVFLVIGHMYFSWREWKDTIYIHYDPQYLQPSKSHMWKQINEILEKNYANEEEAEP